jgi:hypothetical protein
MPLPVYRFRRFRRFNCRIEAESTLVRFARHLHARRGLAEATVHNYTSAIRRLVPVIGLQPMPKAVEQYIERMHKAGASYLVE